MSSSAALKALLTQKRSRDEETGRVASREKAVAERSAWLKGLFDDIERWLKPSVDDGIVEVARDGYAHPDEQLGMLSEESLTLKVGASEVFFAPRMGTIAGAAARVDMTSRERTIPIVYLRDRGWHFLIRDSVTRTEEVTDDSFVEALREILAE